MSFVFENISTFQKELQRVGSQSPSGSFLRALRENVASGAESFEVEGNLEEGEDSYILRVFFTIDDSNENDAETPIAALPVCRFDCLWLEKIEG
ncbi:hypothetical protein [Bacillus altitudinis]|uniref:hypothetical protein n=1 Tax=Bacillus altitudinis TaxID=293387 RepID=UPI002943B442|nr:hypothetical protein [Bacillus altitudinis]WOI41954.1 hypothetical protein RZ534_03245 [Bacillus altitudinis]